MTQLACKHIDYSTPFEQEAMEYLHLGHATAIVKLVERPGGQKPKPFWHKAWVSQSEWHKPALKKKVMGVYPDIQGYCEIADASRCKFYEQGEFKVIWIDGMTQTFAKRNVKSF